MQNVFNYLLKKDDIGEPPWDYDFLLNLDESEYPKYLAKIFKYRTGEKLPLKFDFKIKNWIIDKNKCKTFNQKIQWIKLYGVNKLMRKCTDKVKVRDYVKEKIGNEYLKPVLQICDSFDEIDFDKLPNCFVIKCNNGSKWQYFIKKKDEFLQNKRLFDIIKRNITGWLEQEFWVWGGFELQYKDIKSKVIIETLLANNEEIAQEIEVFCFNGEIKLIKRFYNSIPNQLSVYDENLNNLDFKFLDNEIIVNIHAEETLKQIYELSLILSKDFVFVRVDWLLYQGKFHFNELTFSPYSGFIYFDEMWNLKMGNWLNLKGYKNEF